MFCRECGEYLDSKDKFCPICGTEVLKTQSLNNETEKKHNITRYQRETYLSQKRIGMKWLKYLLFFEFITQAVISFGNAILTITGNLTIYDGIEMRTLTYDSFPNSLFILLFLSCVYLGQAVLSLYARKQIYDFRKTAYQTYVLYLSYYLFMSMSAVQVILNSVSLASARALYKNVVIFEIVYVIVLVGLNFIYFKKRSDLFVF